MATPTTLKMAQSPLPKLQYSERPGASIMAAAASVAIQPGSVAISMADPESSAAASCRVKHEPVPKMTRRAASPMVLALRWREIQGQLDWDGLVEPLHPLLRQEIVRYGELVNACYKAFDLDPQSKRYLNCKHGKRRMLQAVGMADAGYEVTKYIYASPDIAVQEAAGVGPCPSRWIGYVAEATDDAARLLGRRDILVSFRGTVTGAEWAANLMSSLAPARFDPADPRLDVKVESGFLSLYTSDDATCRFTCGSCRDQLLSEIARLVEKHKNEEVSITLAGHSMGSSLALLLGYDLAELGLNRTAGRRAAPITVFSFGGPRVGNVAFKNRCDELGVKVLRVANVNDPVTKLPGVFLNERSGVLGGWFELPWRRSCYAHVGVELPLNFFDLRAPACVHDLEAYIGLLRTSSPAESSSMKESPDQLWRWQMAALQVGDFMQVLGF